jgi:hypothetical protein
MAQTQIKEDQYGKYVRTGGMIMRPHAARDAFYDEVNDGWSRFVVGHTINVGVIADTRCCRVKSFSVPGYVEVWSSHGRYYGQRSGRQGTVHPSWECWRPGLLRCVDVPEGEHGGWVVERFEVSESAAALENTVRGRREGRLIFPGRYTRIGREGSDVIMSDTPAEIHEHRWLGQVSGTVCITGLGLGVAVQAALDNPRVTKVWVIEKEADVIKLVAGHYRARYGDKLIVVHADAHVWKPNGRYKFDYVWHDIWPDIDGRHYEDMKKLHRHWGRYAYHQESWLRKRMRKLYKENRQAARR